MRWRVGEGLAAGSAAVLLSLISYASPVEERTLWRWSHFDAAALGVVLLVVVVTFLILRSPGSGPIDGGRRPAGSRAASYCRDLGWAVWGLGYLVGSAFAFDTRGRLLRLDFLNSVVPGAAYLQLAGVILFVTGVVISLWNGAGKKWALALGLPALLIFGGEAWARWNAMSHPRVTPLESTALDRWRRLHIQLNPAGYRDSVHEIGKRDGFKRLIVIGDEVAQGLGIPSVGDRYSEQLAFRLSAATGETWDPMNLGRPGTHTKDHVAALPGALRYSPDLVVLLYSFDDIEYFAPVRRREVLAQPAMTWQDRLHPIRLPYVNSVLFQEAFLELRARRPALVGAAPLADDPYLDPALLAAHFEELQNFAQAAEEQGVMTLIVPLDVEVSSDSARMRRYREFATQAEGAQLPVWAVDSTLDGRSTRQLIVDPIIRLPNEMAHLAAAEATVARVLYLRSPQSAPVVEGGAGTSP
jgi:hypothetical protein